MERGQRASGRGSGQAVCPDDGTLSECPDDDRHIAEIIAILLEQRGFTGEKCSEIHIGLSVEELPVIRELRFRDGTVLRDEPLVSYDLLQSPVRDECKEIEAFWGWIPEQEDDFLGSVRTLLIDKLSGWERVRIDVSGVR